MCGHREDYVLADLLAAQARVGCLVRADVAEDKLGSLDRAGSVFVGEQRFQRTAGVGHGGLGAAVIVQHGVKQVEHPRGLGLAACRPARRFRPVGSKPSDTNGRRASGKA